MVKRTLLFIGSILFFILGCYLYGMFLNIKTDSLKEQMAALNLSKISNPSIVIDKKNYTLTLFSDSIPVKTYRAVFGRNAQEKHLTGDRATPIGEYKICAIDSVHLYYKFFRLNYPNLADLTEGLRRGTIDQKEYENLRTQFYYEDFPNQQTLLGGNIGIHGIGQLNFLFKNLPFVFNWTDGSIAISNEEIDELYGVIKKGTKVTIY